MTCLEELRQALVRYLNACGVSAIAAWESGKKVRRDEAVITVSLRGCEGGPAGFQDYLGEFWNEEKGCWVERYGRKAELSFGLDLWGPRSSGESACTELFSKLAQVLTVGSPEGLVLREISCGETVFDEDEGLFHCPVKAVGTVFLETSLDESGVFTDFTVKGTRQ